MYVLGLISRYGVAVMAEWLRRWTRNPMGYSRAGSNPVHSEVAVLVAPISVPSVRFAKWTSMSEKALMVHRKSGHFSSMKLSLAGVVA